MLKEIVAIRSAIYTSAKNILYKISKNKKLIPLKKISKKKQMKMNIITKDWKSRILNEPKREYKNDGWMSDIRERIKIDGIQGHCALFWIVKKDKKETLEFIFWADNVCKHLFYYKKESETEEIDAFLTALVDDVMPRVKLNLEGELEPIDGASEILCEINDIFGTLEIPNIVADAQTIMHNCITCGENTMTKTHCCDAYLCVRCLSKIPWKEERLTCPTGCGSCPYRYDT